MQPDAGAGAEEDLSRSTAAEREFEDYMKTPPAANSHDFDLLNAWKSYATDGVDAKTGKVVTPARLPHIGLLARLHLGIDTTSCQAERNFSALSALLGDLQSNLGRRKVEMMMLLKLNQQLIPGLVDVLQQVVDLKDATAAGGPGAAKRQPPRPVPPRKKNTAAPSRLGKKIQPSRPVSEKQTSPVPLQEKKRQPRTASKTKNNRPVPPRISTPIFCQSRARAEMKKVGQPSIFTRPVPSRF